MKETNFIEQNKHKWNEFEKELRSGEKKPEKLSKLFIETTDDLSFSRTYYPNRSVRVYLNDIAQQIFQKIYKTKTDKKKNFGSFWSLNLPRALWENRKILWWATGIFLSGFIIAILSSNYSPDFAEIMLGAQYIEVTIQNINSGDPMAIYGNMDPVEMFLYIAKNNIRVCFIVFVLGMFAGVGTILILLKESIRIGAFLYFFYAKDLFEDAFYAVMLHGTIELSMIVLSGMAGMVLAKGLVFPKSYSRLQSFVLSARQGIMIMLGISAFLLVAAFIEGFATRHTDVSNIIRGTVIFSSFAIVIAYFVLYPYSLYRRGKFDKEEKDELLHEKETHLIFEEIKSAGQIFTEVFYFFKKFFNTHIKTAAWIGIIGAGVLLLVLGQTDFVTLLIDESDIYFNDYILLVILDVVYPWNEVNNLLNFETYPFLFGMMVVILTLITFVTSINLKKEKYPNEIGKFIPIKTAINTLLLSSLMLSPFFFHSDDSFRTNLVLVLYMLFVFPVFVITNVTVAVENIHFFKAFARIRLLLKGNYGKLLLTSFFLMALPWIMCISCSSWMWSLIDEVVSLNISTENETLPVLPHLIYTAFMLFIMCLSFPIYVYGMGLLHSSLIEINEGKTLRMRINNITVKKKVYGIEGE